MDPSAAAPASAWALVAVAAITATGAIIAAFISRGNRKAIEAVHEEVRTNHGKTAGQHLEGLEDVMVQGMAAMAQVLADALNDHTASDAENFEELRALLKAQNERQVEATALRYLERKGLKS